MYPMSQIASCVRLGIWGGGGWFWEGGGSFIWGSGMSSLAFEGAEVSGAHSGSIFISWVHYNDLDPWPPGSHDPGTRDNYLECSVIGLFHWWFSQTLFSFYLVAPPLLSLSSPLIVPSLGRTTNLCGVSLSPEELFPADRLHAIGILVFRRRRKHLLRTILLPWRLHRSATKSA